MSAASVRQLLRDKIADGRLPRNPAGAVSATNGTGQTCDACSTPVSHGEVLHKISLAGFKQIRFHATCFATWRDERENMSSVRAALD
jgi:hypothetical protein